MVASGPGSRDAGEPNGSGRLRAVAAGVLAVLALAGSGRCSAAVGSPDSVAGWQDTVDKTLGAALSSLGTARLLLENQARGRLRNVRACQSPQPMSA